MVGFSKVKSKERNFNNIKRLVVKLGSSSLTYKTGKLNLEFMENLVCQLADLHNQGKELLVVTSGAIGAGLGKLGLASRPKAIPEKQATAAIGQGILMHMYEKLFAEYGITVGQVLLTREDFSDRRRFINACNTLYTLLQFKAIPIINENDTVAVDEIKLGDNDNLAALVAGVVDAQLLIMLSDIDGLYNANPHQVEGASLIFDIEEITSEIEALAGKTDSLMGTGGMVTKLQAAKIAMHSGLAMVIAKAEEKNVVWRILAGERIGTMFWPVGKLESKKRWIAYSSSVQGKIYVDDGAIQAMLYEGKSLLPSGVTGVEGSFEAGSTVGIVGSGGKEIGRGIVNFSALEVDRIKRVQTKDIACILGKKDYDEIVHRNNLVLEW